MDQNESHLEQGETPENHQNMESLLAAEGLGNIESPVQGETRKGNYSQHRRKPDSGQYWHQVRRCHYGQRI